MRLKNYADAVYNFYLSVDITRLNNNNIVYYTVTNPSGNYACSNMVATIYHTDKNIAYVSFSLSANDLTKPGTYTYYFYNSNF